MIACSARFALPALWIVASAGALTAQKPPCAPGNDGLNLPKGFCAVMVAESLGRVRHLAVAPNGDIFAAKAGASRPGRGTRRVALRRRGRQPEDLARDVPALVEHADVDCTIHHEER